MTLPSREVVKKALCDKQFDDILVLQHIATAYINGELVPKREVDERCKIPKCECDGQAILHREGG